MKQIPVLLNTKSFFPRSFFFNIRTSNLVNRARSILYVEHSQAFRTVTLSAKKPSPQYSLFHSVRTEDPLWFPRGTSCLCIPPRRSRISFVDIPAAGHFLFRFPCRFPFPDTRLSISKPVLLSYRVTRNDVKTSQSFPSIKPSTTRQYLQNYKFTTKIRERIAEIEK